MGVDALMKLQGMLPNIEGCYLRTCKRDASLRFYFKQAQTM